MADWINLFAVYREVLVQGDEIVQGVLLPELQPEDPRVRAVLDGWAGTHFLHQTPHGTELTLIRRRRARRRERWWLHLLLGLATLLTTTIAGAYFLGRDPLELVVLPLGPLGIPMPTWIFPAELVPGLAFSVPLLVVLFGHEMGHYLMARWHRMDVSPPYFIPSPNWLNFIGTFGAFIRLRSAMLNRAMLLDVGAAGPLVSFVLSLPLLALGLTWSQPVSFTTLVPAGSYAVLFGAQPLWLGDSLAMHLLVFLFAPPGEVLLLHPFAFAGWLGLFVTSLNLFPLSQLDGGHILYALLGRVQGVFGYGFLALLGGLGFVWWGWWFWVAVILLLGRGTVRHPPVFDPAYPVLGARRRAGYACVLIFLATFIPIPLQG